MPAYRSQDEADIRIPVTEMLREMIPGCRIINEINACSFGNRIDVLAVGKDRIAAVEIKSKKDKLDRLPAQARAMFGVTYEVYAAMHEKFLQITPPHRPGGMQTVMPPQDVPHYVTEWIWPQKQREGHVHVYCREAWQPSHYLRKGRQCLPDDALAILWREELHGICRALKIKGVAKLSIDAAIDVIKFNLTGQEIKAWVCATLRARECPEADPPIYEELKCLNLSRSAT